MKRNLLYLLMIFAAVQCRKEDDNPAIVVEPMLQGKWFVVSHSVVDDRTGTPELPETLYTDCEKKTYVEYLDAGKGKSVRYRETFADCILETDANFIYLLDKTNKVITHTSTYNQSVFNYNIVKLTDTELVTKLYFLSDSGGVFHTVYELKTFKRN